MLELADKIRTQVPLSPVGLPFWTSYNINNMDGHSSPLLIDWPVPNSLPLLCGFVPSTNGEARFSNGPL